MSESVSDRIVHSIGIACGQYHRLVLVVASAGSGKTVSLQDIHARIQAPLINVNLELSKRMLDLTERQRVLKLPLLLDEITIDASSDVVLLDNSVCSTS